MGIVSNLRIGIREGVGYAALYAAVGVLSVLVRGPDLLREYQISVGELLAFYVVGGVSAGVIAGALLPLGRHPVGAIVVGFLAMLPTCVVGSLLVFSPHEWKEMIPAVPLIAAAIYGVFGGLMMWNYHFNRER